MSSITQLGRVMVPVADQEKAIAFYTESSASTSPAPMERDARPERARTA